MQEIFPCISANHVSLEGKTSISLKDKEPRRKFSLHIKATLLTAQASVYSKAP
jgi:hypothetical protein